MVRRLTSPNPIIKVMKINRFRIIFVAPLFALFLGCAPFLAKPTPLSFEKPEQCREFLNRLAEVVEEAGVKDASNAPIRGFPYLRANRFIASLKKDLKDDGQREEWLLWMQQQDLLSRKKEISNLPDKAILSLDFEDGRKADREWLYAQVKSCSSNLLSHDRGRSDLYSRLFPLVHFPDEYSCFGRAVGLYPLVAIPVAVLTDRSIKKIRKRFDADLKDLPIDGQLRTFIPEKRASLSGEEVQEIIRESKKNLMGVPLPNTDQEEKLVWSFAPVFIQDVAAAYDRLGQVVWKSDRVDIDPEKPTVYYYTSHAFLKGEPILQINYVIWYSERAGERSPSIELGHLDGLTVRVSLDGEGKVFMVDVMSDCGCYHFFSPERERVERVRSRPLSFEPIMPEWLPAILSEGRLGIRVNSGWHQVQRLIPVEEVPDPIPYALVRYDVLEALPHEDGTTESIFSSKGIVKGSERVERFILFSMGIPSVGSMRQRGHHAIELIGRDYFDNPYLFDENFVFK
ncbi:MAG: hypothetical protein ACXVAB_12725 [Thermodesulfobacteriota bacterium]